MKISKSEAVAGVIVIAAFVAAAIAYPYMPDLMASHWNVAGEVNGYMSKFWGVYLMPAISAAMLLLFIVVPRIDPKKENIEKFRKYFDRFILLILLFLFYIYGLTLWWSLGGRFNMNVFLAPAFGALFFCIGSLVANAKMNYTIGIRTPWTLANEEVWRKTHELGGKLFKITGVLALCGIIFSGMAIWFILAPVFATTVAIVIYSYVEYRRQTKKS